MRSMSPGGMNCESTPVIIVITIAISNHIVWYRAFNSARLLINPHEKFFVDGIGDFNLLNRYEEILTEVALGQQPMPTINSMEWLQRMPSQQEARLKRGTPVVEWVNIIVYILDILNAI